VNETVMIGDLAVTSFLKLHDAADPCSFIIEYKGVKAGVITDIGSACERVVHYFKQCHACFLESNYDEKMLAEGNYSARLKKRIRGGKGHLSNSEALKLFTNHRPAFMSHLLLSHLSKNNNHPDLVNELFKNHAESTSVIVASRYKETGVYTITKNQDEHLPVIPYHIVKREGMQMKMFI
jgi:phosphoribosyl 1,2-cyclic phosphodiesterase